MEKGRYQVYYPDLFQHLTLLWIIQQWIPGSGTKSGSRSLSRISSPRSTTSRPWGWRVISSVLSSVMHLPHDLVSHVLLWSPTPLDTTPYTAEPLVYSQIISSLTLFSCPKLTFQQTLQTRNGVVTCWRRRPAEERPQLRRATPICLYPTPNPGHTPWLRDYHHLCPS